MRRSGKTACGPQGLKKAFFFVAVFFPAVLLLFADFNGLQRAVREKLWSIGFCGGASPEDLHPLEGIYNPVITIKTIPGFRVQAVADPFLFREKGEWYLFFEVISGLPGQGNIGFAVSGDLSRWRYGGVALDEPFHLSYPYVFRSGHEIYMIPETHEVDAVRLYRAVLFPAEWEYVRTLVSAVAVSDASILQAGGKWWLFAGNTACDTLRLYHADRLQGPWQEHPKSPIYEGNVFFSRPAGRIVTEGSRIIRFSQQGIPVYGRQVWAFEILKMTEKEYEERLLSDRPVLSPTGGVAWNGQGMHHIDLHRLDSGEWIAAVDGFRERCGTAAFMNSVLNRSGKFFQRIF